MLSFIASDRLFEKFSAYGKKRHRRGFFIYAPSCSGKTTFLKSDKNKDWVEGDYIWEAGLAHPHHTTKWWENRDPDFLDYIDIKSDIITHEAREYGLWIMGASNYWLRPDAVVLPPWSTHLKFIRARNAKQGETGLRDIDHLKKIRRVTRKKYTRANVPIFPSVELATRYIQRIAGQKTPKKHSARVLPLEVKKQSD